MKLSDDHQKRENISQYLFKLGLSEELPAAPAGKISKCLTRNGRCEKDIPVNIQIFAFMYTKKTRDGGIDKRKYELPDNNSCTQIKNPNKYL